MPYGNLVDIAIVLFLFIYVFSHVSEGFLILAARLVSFFASIVLSFLYYTRFSFLLDKVLPLSPGILDALAFIILFVAVQAILRVVFSILFDFFSYQYRPSSFSKFFAVIPAFIDGLVVTSLLLLVLVVMPLLPQVKSPIEESRIGSRLVDEAARAEVYIDRVFGRATEETLGFLTTKPDEDEFLNLPFRVENTSVEEEAELKMLALINAERAKAGAPPLVIDQEITAVARAHSEDMWRRGYFAHENPDGESPFDRMEEGGVEFVAAGENLALARTVERAHQGLMNSPGHKRNILDPNFRRIGIGVISGGLYGQMFTQDFAD